MLILAGCTTLPSAEPTGNPALDDRRAGIVLSTQAAPSAPVPETAKEPGPEGEQGPRANTKPADNARSDTVEEPPAPDREHSVYFSLGSAAIDNAAREVIHRHAAKLKADPRIKVALLGHTDHSGSREYNVALGQARVNAVERELRALGVPGNQIRRRPFGNEKAGTANCGSEACRQSLRRVELRYSN